MSNTVYVNTQRNPGCLIQILWFAFIGVWLGLAWAIVAWLLMVSIIGMPLGVAMLNALPTVTALRKPPERVAVSTQPGGVLVERPVAVPQAPLLLRILYFILVGWWLSALWIEAAFLLCASVIGLPLGFWMFDLVPTVLTLRR